ncbi:MAG: DUF2304 domain-containing protein [Planctomycetes bacterium]|nr:DUF2304 domain-containing protein [Planctomycetota bacterium]
MNLFQILALGVVGLLLLVSVTGVLRGSVARRDGILWTLLWLAAGIAIIRPGVTRVVAKALGIGRGADLVLYCAVVVMMIGFLMTYSRLRRIQRDLTLVVRHIAKREAAVNLSPAEDNAPSDQGPATDSCAV